MLAVSVIFAFRDSKGKESTTRVHIPTTFSFAQYLEFGEAAAQVMAGMSTAEIYNVSIAFGLDLSAAALKTVATQFADVFQKGFLAVTSVVAGLFAKFNIPTFDEANLVAGSDVMDVADADVAALITLIEDGLDDGGIPIRPVNSRNDALSEVTLAVEKFRRS